MTQRNKNNISSQKVIKFKLKIPSHTESYDKLIANTNTK
jgi:hypothetical protein